MLSILILWLLNFYHPFRKGNSLVRNTIFLFNSILVNSLGGGIPTDLSQSFSNVHKCPSCLYIYFLNVKKFGKYFLNAIQTEIIYFLKIKKKKRKNNFLYISLNIISDFLKLKLIKVIQIFNCIK